MATVCFYFENEKGKECFITVNSRLKWYKAFVFKELLKSLL